MFTGTYSIATSILKMFDPQIILGVLNTVFLNISNDLSHLELRNRSIQIVVITNFIGISNVGIKRFGCT